MDNKFKRFLYSLIAKLEMSEEDELVIEVDGSIWKFYNRLLYSSKSELKDVVSFLFRKGFVLDITKGRLIIRRVQK